jgi:hypothetical protein
MGFLSSKPLAITSLHSQLLHSIPATTISKPDPDQLPNFAMHANSIIALAIGATAVSAAAVPGLEVRQANTFLQFPASLDCPEGNGLHVLKKDLVEAAKTANRDGEPYEQSASNLANKHCGTPKFNNIPLWIVSHSLDSDD